MKMRGFIWLLCLFVLSGNMYSFDPQWDRNKTHILSNKNRLINDLDLEQWDPEWALEPDEQEPPSRSEILGARACMCVMTCTCISVFLWALITNKIRA